MGWKEGCVCIGAVEFVTSMRIICSECGPACNGYTIGMVQLCASKIAFSFSPRIVLLNQTHPAVEILSMGMIAHA